MFTVKICAKNDSNGNPRRGWLCYSPAGKFLGFIDRGYEGWPRGLKASCLCELQVELAEYRDALKGKQFQGVKAA